MSAVSRSRISPTITTSGSCRNIARKPAANVMPTFAFTCVWPMPSTAYSTGSSTVRILREPSFKRFSPAYSVVVLPDPVGPVTRIMPLGSANASRKIISASSDMPSRSSDMPAFSLSKIRITTRSPARLGNVDTRTSTSFPPSVRPIRPSCGIRRSAMSSRAMTLIRLTTTGATLAGKRSRSCKTPSARMRITKPVSYGSI